MSDQTPPTMKEAWHTLIDNLPIEQLEGMAKSACTPWKSRTGAAFS